MKQFIIIAILLFSAYTLFAQSTQVLINTSMGEITVELYDDTPIHRDNFIKLTTEKFYDGVLFHRVINNFMIQTGDPQSKDASPNTRLGSGGPGYTLEAEILPKYFHKKGALSAARLGDQANPEKRSSGSQFYIVQGQQYTDMQLDSFEKRLNTTFSTKQRDAYVTEGGTPHLDGGYTVFGQVIKGMDIIDSIATTKTGVADRPTTDVKIISMEIIKK